MKPQFGNRAQADLLAIFHRSPGTLASVRDCIAREVGFWAWPSVQKFSEQDVREAVRVMGEERHV